MDQLQYSTLLSALSAVPDPRKARGKQYSWSLLLTLVSSALGSAERSGHGIASWVVEHTAPLLVWLHPERVDCQANQPGGARSVRCMSWHWSDEWPSILAQSQSPQNQTVLSSASRAKSCKVRHLMAKPCAAPVRMLSQPTWSLWCSTPAR